MEVSNYVRIILLVGEYPKWPPITRGLSLAPSSQSHVLQCFDTWYGLLKHVSQGAIKTPSPLYRITGYESMFSLKSSPKTSPVKKTGNPVALVLKTQRECE